MPPLSRQQGGSIAIMALGALIVILAFCGFSLSLGMVYNRKIEMQDLSDAVAMSAARQLDGTAGGIDRALAAAASAAGQFQYAYRSQDVQWSDSAISFASAPDGGTRGWMSGASAKAQPDTAFFTKVNTAALDPAHGQVGTVFLSMFNQAVASVQINGSTVAGRITSNVIPFGVCAMSNAAATSRSGELVEYGFRRGISYDLMQLNPNGTSAENFLINPIAPSGTIGSSVSANTSLMAPYVCTGTMAIPQVVGGQLTVERSFPLSTYYPYINSRFGTYSAPCKSLTAPPDANVKPYSYSSNVPWMKSTPTGQAASQTTSGGKLWTVADPSPSPAGTTGPMYGPLWAYAKAVKYSSYVPGQAEPASGYTAFATTDWATLYTPGAPAAVSYPSSPPYKATSGTSFQAPPAGLKSLRNRRVLNVPLLQCPVPAGAKASGQVLAVGKFFLTVPATSTQLIGEFAGVAAEQTLIGQVEIFR